MRRDQPIITSLLDTDLYKFTMQQTMLHYFNGAVGEYAFKCRTPGLNLTRIIPQLREEIEHLCSLQYSFSEIAYLKSLPFIKADYLDFLKDFQLKKNHLTIDKEGEELVIRAHGPMVQTSPFEIYILALVQELYMRQAFPEVSEHEGRKRLAAKVDYLLEQNLPKFRLADFGTRRRFSKHWQYQVVDYLRHRIPNNFVGSSNVYLAKELGLKPIGTMAHEYLQAFQAFTNPADSQKMALETWVQEYRGDLGVALTDVIGMDYFLKDCDLYFAKLFDGFRHDSGDPYVWAEKLIRHLTQLGINPKTKFAVFSDGLTIEKAVALHQRFEGEINTSFGIGTHLTNDLGAKPASIVMKLVTCNHKPVAKLSDSEGKTMCEDSAYIDYLMSVKAAA
jgi:nicotinate phosphoribosyltransferase